MVKKIIKLSFQSFLLCIAFFVSSCGLDILGFVGIPISSALDERLKERDNFVLLDANNWRTALTDLETDYSFLVVADLHFSDGDSRGFEKLKGVIEDNDIKFMVVLGDITTWSAKKDIELFIDIINGFGIPCYPLIGNHDIYLGAWSYWKELIGSTNYRINAGSTTLLIMDNANLYFGKQQMDWLERELKSTAERVFVFAHAQLFDSGPVGAQRHDINERARVASILRGKADAMFMGHTHNPERHEVGGVKYITLDAFENDGHYVIVSVNGSSVKYDFREL